MHRDAHCHLQRKKMSCQFGLKGHGFQDGSLLGIFQDTQRISVILAPLGIKPVARLPPGDAEPVSPKRQCFASALFPAEGPARRCNAWCDDLPVLDNVG
jgi:hypothetical protein